MLLSYVRRAVDDYAMIEKGDRIAVGLSGGKDSLTLLFALAKMRRFYPKPYDLEAVTVSLGFGNEDFTKITDFCESLGVRHTVVQTDIGPIIFDERKEKNPCSLCSKLRKGALNDKIKELGCNKSALGHNRDDVIETFFMSLFFEGRLYSFSPVTYLDRKDLTVIRPLIYTPERDVVSFVKKQNIETAKNPCPANGFTKREEIKRFVLERAKNDRFFEEKVFGAIQRAGIGGWKLNE